MILVLFKICFSIYVLIGIIIISCDDEDIIEESVMSDKTEGVINAHHFCVDIDKNKTNLYIWSSVVDTIDTVHTFNCYVNNKLVKSDITINNENNVYILEIDLPNKGYNSIVFTPNNQIFKGEINFSIENLSLYYNCKFIFSKDYNIGCDVIVSNYKVSCSDDPFNGDPDYNNHHGSEWDFD